MPTISVSSVVSATVPASHIQITVGRNQEKGSPRITRSIIIPELRFDASIPDKFVSILANAFYAIAREQLGKLWDSNESLAEVSGNIWSTDSLLVFNATEAESKRLSKATISTFWADSLLRAKFLAKAAPQKLMDGILSKLYIAANPNDKGSTDENLRLITWLEDDFATENLTATLLVSAFARKNQELAKLNESLDLMAIDL